MFSRLPVPLTAEEIENGNRNISLCLRDALSEFIIFQTGSFTLKSCIRNNSSIKKKKKMKEILMREINSVVVNLKYNRIKETCSPVQLLL